MSDIVDTASCIVRACVDNKDERCTNPKRIISEHGCAMTRLLGADPQELYARMIGKGDKI